jgi:hypothetical protein
MKQTSKIKTKIKNISLNEFEKMALDAAENAGIKDIATLTVSFQKVKKETETTNNFFVHYEFKEKENDFYGLSALPELAIAEAMEKYKQMIGASRINAQTKIMTVDVKLLDGPINIGVDILAKLNEKFTDLTKVTLQEAMAFITEITKAVI